MSTSNLCFPSDIIDSSYLLSWSLEYIIFMKCFDLLNMKRDTEWKTNSCCMFCCSFSTFWSWFEHPLLKKRNSRSYNAGQMSKENARQSSVKNVAFICQTWTYLKSQNAYWKLLCVAKIEYYLCYKAF